MDRRIWLDGAFVPWEAATVHVLSHSLQRGSLIFDYLSVHETPRGPAVFRLGEHVDRFLRSAELMGLPLALSRDEIAAATLETVRRNPGATAVKMCGFLPSIEIDVVPMDDRVSVAIAAYDPRADIVERNRGEYHFSPKLKLWIEKQRRNRRRDIVDPQAKVAANYASPMAAKWAARKRGFDEVLFVDADEFVAEGPTTNVFFFDRDGALNTPPVDQILLGITRQSIIEIAKHDGIEVRERPTTVDELMGAAEVFLTATSAGVWPVVDIDGQPVGDGDTGPRTRALRERFERISLGRDDDFLHWLAVVE